MAHSLQELLGNDHPLFSQNIAELERMSGHAGIDTRLIADCIEKAHDVMRKLKLDTADTTAEELYGSLLSTVVNGYAPTLLAGTAYTLLNVGGDIVSFNLLDIVESAHHQLDFAHRVLGHGQRHLRAEVVRRYAEHERTNETSVHGLADETGLKPPSDEGQPMLPVVAPERRIMVQKEGEQTMPRILAIGDIFTDAFITLGDETAKIIKEGDTEWLAVPFGRKPPYDHVDIVKSVGPSPNVAVSIARLGFDASLMAWVGGDATGAEALEHLHGEHVNTDSMVVEQDKATSYWYVLCYKADRTMLVKSEKYRYEWHDPETKPEWIYLAYIGEDSWPLHEGLLDYLERNPDVKFALQPGTFQFKWGLEKMAPLYRRSNMALMNREEAMDVTGLPHDSIKDLANGLHDLGPETVVITDGPNGSYASQAGKVYTIPNYPDPAPPVERTGAGDAFSSTFVAAIAAGESIETALAWAPINSMNVVQHVGAQAGLLTLPEIKHYLETAPEDYRVTEVTG